MQLGKTAGFIKTAWTFLALGILAANLLFGQTPTSGTITGHVRGPGATSVPGATVQLTNPQTGERKETWTDESGDYTFNDIKPGTYRIDVSLVGFRPDAREPVPVTSDKVLKVNVALVLALPESSAPQKTQAPARPRGDLANLPMERRDRPESLGDSEETPGEGPGAGGAAGSVRIAEGAGIENPVSAETSEVDTSASAANSFLLAGGMGNMAGPGEGGFGGGRGGRMRGGGGFGGGGEFGGGPGEGGPGGGGPFGGGPGQGGPGGGGFGGGGGGFGGGGGGGGGGVRGWGRNRSQTNRVRGNITEQYANSAFDAHPYPLNVASLPQVPSYHETFGFSLGGPLVIPRILNARDKTSWFASYNLQRGQNGLSNFATVPTAAERLGDFSGALIPSGPYAGTVPTLYDPLSSATGARAAFMGNIIPTPRLNSAATGLLSYIPLPNLPGTVQNYRLQESLPTANDRVMARIGQQINSKDSLNVMYNFNSARSRSVSGFPALTSHTSSRGQSVNLSNAHL